MAHPILDVPITDSFTIATVLRGPFTGEKVSVIVQFSDGKCICEIDNGYVESYLEVISLEDLRVWIPVESINVGKKGELISYTPK